MSVIIDGQVTGQNYLKSIVYDFDGLTINQTDLPEGDYKYGDLSYKVVANPLKKSDMLGDRVLELDLNWNSGEGDFGKGMSRFIELDASKDMLNFYFYNPLSNSSDASVTAIITEDDDKDNVFDITKDDQWVRNVQVSRSADWQLISLPLNTFVDENTGGNGIFDVGYTGGAGMTFTVGIRIDKGISTSAVSEQYFLDMLCFSEGTLPTGATILDLPSKSKNDYCLLGAYSQYSETAPEKVPSEIEGLLPVVQGKKLKYVNYFHPFSKDGTTNADYLPNQSVQTLLTAGYTPIITWEPLYQHLARLDPAQPRLNNILAGEFDSYIDAFADKLVTFNDTVIVRLMHEFEGDWYPWSLTENNQDPTRYISAYRHIVDRCRARGAAKVKWMWCLNAAPKPYLAYNWVVSAYPGDAYVDIVATDIYNHPDLGIPDWKSFRYTGIESYYYLAKYFPQKPLFICEVGSRERDPSEDATSQSKADWIIQMNKEVQSNFHKARALVFFSSVKEHDWRINSSPASLEAVKSFIWADNYYFGNSSISNVNDISNKGNFTTIYPNPFNDTFSIITGETEKLTSELFIYDVLGRLVFKTDKLKSYEKITTGSELHQGVYFVEVKNDLFTKSFKVIKTAN